MIIAQNSAGTYFLLGNDYMICSITTEIGFITLSKLMTALNLSNFKYTIEKIPIGNCFEHYEILFQWEKIEELKLMFPEYFI